MTKRLACKLGIHQVFHDNVGKRTLIGEYEFWQWETYEACNYCDYRKKIN